MIHVTAAQSYKRRSWIPGSVLLALAVCLQWACSDIMEPAPEVNTSALPPVAVLSGVAVRGFQPGQHVAGMITLSFEGFPAHPKTESSALTQSPGGNLIGISSSTPPVFTFQANGLPEGPLHVRLTLFADRDPSLGLLNLLNENEFVPATKSVLDTTLSLIIDHTPPNDVQNLRIDWTWHPTLTWSANTDLNFKAYIIRRVWPTPRTDMVYQQSRTSMTDSSQLPYIGEAARYKVSVWNGATESAGNEVGLSYGIMWPIRYTLYALLPGPVTDELYGFLGGDTVKVVSASTMTVLRTAAFSRFLNGSYALQGLTGDGSILYWFDPADNTLNRMRASDLTLYPKAQIAQPWWGGNVFAVTADRLFEVTPEGRLICIDATTGAQIGSGVPSFGFSGTIAVSPDGKTLYAARGDSKLTRYDVSADSFVVTGQAPIPAGVTEIIPIRNANAIGLRLGETAVCVVDTGTLSVVNTITSPDRIADECFTPTRAYVSTAKAVIEYDLRGGPTGRRWVCPESPYHIAVDRNGATLFAEVSAGGKVAVWAVPLR